MFSFFKKQADDIPSIWSRFEKWLSKNASHLNSELNTNASEVDITKLEKTIGGKLPKDYIEFLKIHNGQERDSEGLIDTEEFLSTDRVIEEWSVWKDLLDKGDFKESESEPDEGIKPDWWNSKWIPITYDGNGNHYCIDIDPSSSGTNGQIIRMWHDSGERELIANSFKEWISNYVNDLEKGKYVYSEDWGGIINKEEL
ncbi:molybdenum cofactor biosynthesis protein MoeA [Flammeovirga sp. MY04]|uniref:SMI1/KNR4 family protein n=1 Tax=Flammeovirga sp. MY04 TaxID=1191459 RepID=UPI00080609BC|nr:SMI1/KNR4 family protein [Flammeovirga sp. MY04]ANQ49389.1 molybdenum cofactor biosynthesis protein MoeA [Flammeovirga sp. MY04]